jgi:hypothetical protein
MVMNLRAEWHGVGPNRRFSDETFPGYELGHAKRYRTMVWGVTRPWSLVPARWDH